MSWAWPDGWYPTVGAVAVTKKPISVSRFAGFRYWAHCESCGSETSRDTLLAANAARREHLCRPGTLGANPQCPICRATGPKCYGSGGWHAERVERGRAGCDSLSAAARQGMLL